MEFIAASKTVDSQEKAEQAGIRIVTIKDAAMQMDTYFICNVSHGDKTHFPDPASFS
jgi:hypothetical protein